MSTDHGPGERDTSSGAGCYLGAGGLILLSILLLNGMIARNNQAILQNNQRIQENNSRIQEQQRDQQRLMNRQRDW